MANSNTFYDAFLGHLDALRANTEGILDDFGRYRDDSDPSGSSSRLSSSSLNSALKARLERSQQYFTLMNQFRLSYENNSQNNEKELKDIQKIVVNECLWAEEFKENVQLGHKAYTTLLSQYYPFNYKDLNGRPKMKHYFTMSSSKMALEECDLRNMEDIEKKMKEFQCDLVFEYQRKVINGKTYLKEIQVTVNKEFKVCMPLSPWVVEENQKDDDLSTDIDMTLESEDIKSFGNQLTTSVLKIIILGNDETITRTYDVSNYHIMRTINDHANDAWHAFQGQNQKSCFLHFLSWISMYHKIFGTPCFACKKLLTNESFTAGYLPPSVREYSTGRAYHTQCIVNIQ